MDMSLGELYVQLLVVVAAVVGLGLTLLVASAGFVQKQDETLGAALVQVVNIVNDRTKDFITAVIVIATAIVIAPPLVFAAVRVVQLIW